jgi:hypothetical protein
MEKHSVIYTVPLHVGQNVEVPKGSKVTYYDHDKYAKDDYDRVPQPIEGVACVPWSELAEKFCYEIQRRHHDKLSMQEVRDLGYELYKIVLSQ